MIDWRPLNHADAAIVQWTVKFVSIPHLCVFIFVLRVQKFDILLQIEQMITSDSLIDLLIHEWLLISNEISMIRIGIIFGIQVFDWLIPNVLAYQF